MQIVAVAAGATALVGAVAFVLGRKKGAGAPPAAAPRPGASSLAPPPAPPQRPPEPSAPRAAAAPEDVERARLEAQRLRYEAESAAMQVRQQAEQHANTVRNRAESDIRDLRNKAEAAWNEEERKRQEKMLDVERRLARREAETHQERQKVAVLEKTLEEEKEKLGTQLAEAKSRDEELKAKIAEEEQKLLSIAQLSAQEARDIVMKKFEEACQSDLAKYLEKKEEEKKDRADELAQRIVGTAIQRCAVRYVSDTVTSVIDLPSDEMKGRIIGREGRNIRAIEKATGVDVIVDDTPGVIVISCFDMVRREIARRALEKLINDGRIHPTRIEELIETEKKAIDEDIRNTGKKVCAELGLLKVHAQIQYLIGRLKYRTSYGQNVLEHSIEIAHILSSISSELKLDPLIGKRCGLMHDIGKALTHELDGSHAVLGAEQARRFDEPRLIWNAIGAHHEDMPYESTYAVLTQVGDAISAGRPGARRDSVEQYIERLEKLEAAATSFSGVLSAYAVQAGRELRVLVDADKLDDQQALLTARDIAKKIEDELTYPGEIRVTLIRERKVVEVAR
ncbi:MAG TPA: ribonuclease Y [Planctomycetota bacterium]|nr:ribonuclease Y [Planctomycetota bacterium]